jgi:hypothetical protein
VIVWLAFLNFIFLSSLRRRARMMAKGNSRIHLMKPTVRVFLISLKAS